MKRQLKRSFNRKHQEEIQAVNDFMSKITPQLDEFKVKHPNVGFMLHFALMDDVQHWVSRYCEIDTKLAIQVCTDMLREAIEDSRRIQNETENS